MELISEDYRKQQHHLHFESASAKGKGKPYGHAGKDYGKTMSRIIDDFGINTVLDYGAGRRMSLTETLEPRRKIQYQAYDPAVPGMDELPTPSEMVICIDVLEHIEPEFLMNVLDHLEDLTQILIFASIHTRDAGRILPDGRNAHLIQKPMEWWVPKFQERFDLQSVSRRGSNGFEIFATSKDVTEDDFEQRVLDNSSG
jgi:hypothetical protein